MFTTRPAILTHHQIDVFKFSKKDMCPKTQGKYIIRNIKAQTVKARVQTSLIVYI